MKRLYEIAWPVTEPEYRQDPALSYSTLARYEREGFAKLDTLFEQISSPSLTFGSIVDELITGDKDSFDKRFLVAEFPKLKPAQEKAVQELVATYGETAKSIYDISDSDLLAVLDSCGFNTHFKQVTRLNSIREQECCDYYRLLRASNGKEVISQEDYDDASKCAEALHSSPATGVYFGSDSDDVKRYYQLKFKATIDGVDYRCMADLIVVDYKKKVIVPCDLKTSSHMEYEFADSFIKWRYDIQARLYWRIIRQCMDNDDYFKDFELKPYRFIVVNRHNTKPLVWEFPETSNEEELTYGYRRLRTPWCIGKELSEYLKVRPAVPNGIKTVGLNNITEYLKEKYGREDTNQVDEAG